MVEFGDILLSFVWPMPRRYAPTGFSHGILKHEKQVLRPDFLAATIILIIFWYLPIAVERFLLQKMIYSPEKESLGLQIILLFFWYLPIAVERKKKKRTKMFVSFS